MQQTFLVISVCVCVRLPVFFPKKCFPNGVEKTLKEHLSKITLNTSIQTDVNEFVLLTALIMKPKKLIIHIITSVAPSNYLTLEEPFLVRDTGCLQYVCWPN